MQTFTYKNPDTGKNEVVPQERWCWEVVYLNEHVLKQFDASDGSFHRFGEIDLSQVHIFKMVNRDDPKKTYQVLINPSYMKPIHFYRNLKTVIEVLGKDGKTTVQNELFSRAYVFGYEETYHPVINNNGKDITSQFKLKATVIKHFIFIMPDDGLVVTDDSEKIELAHV